MIDEHLISFCFVMAVFMFLIFIAAVDSNYLSYDSSSCLIDDCQEFSERLL